MAAKPTLIMIRHGETSLNVKKGTMRGWLDIPLDPTGHKQAQAAASEVSKQFKPKRIYASDLLRVRESTEYLSKMTGVAIRYTSSLRPWNGGELVGKVIPNLDQELKYYIEHQSEAPKGGESMKSFLTRLLSFMAQIFDLIEAGVTPVICYTSIRDIEATLGWVEGGMTGKIDPGRLEAKKETVSPGGFVIITTSPRGWNFNVQDSKVKKEGGDSANG